MTEVYFFVRPVRSGKTTSLIKWIDSAPKGSVAGVIAPDDDVARWIQDISTGERHMLTADVHTPESRIVEIGRFRFDQASFRWAHRVLRSGFESVPEWLVFDEIGFLELQGQGLEPAVRRILNWNRKIASTKLLWVVRDELVTDVIDYYGLAPGEYDLWNP
jgi:nucleoside-triphosphatase THEP1